MRTKKYWRRKGPKLLNRRGLWMKKRSRLNQREEVSYLKGCGLNWMKLTIKGLNQPREEVSYLKGCGLDWTRRGNKAWKSRLTEW